MTPDRLWAAWNTDPLILCGLAVLIWLYARGTRALWRSAGYGRGIRARQAAAFGAGVLTLIVALVSPLDQLSDVLFSAHMVQHLLLVTVAAPLIALGDSPLPVLWAWPRRTRTALGRALAWGRVKLPVAFALHSLALWIWHTPVLYEGALRQSWLHATEHLVLVATGVVFWSAAWTGLAHARHVLGASIVYVLALGAQCSALGALISFAPQPWYPFYTQTAPSWGLSAIDDQVLAGLLMWVPAGFVYLAFGLILLGHWLRPAEPLSHTR